MRAPPPHAATASLKLEQEIELGPSVATLLSSPNPSFCNAPATLTAHVTPVNATGSVEFFDASAGGKGGLFPGDPSPATYYNDGLITVGMKFTSDVAGLVTSVRFYRDSRNPGPYTVALWKGDGTLLASAPWTSGPASGWQVVPLATPVLIAANQLHVVGYHTTTYHPQDLPSALATGIDVGPLHAPANTPTNPNGVFSPGAVLTFPTMGNNSSNFFVDIGFLPATRLGSASLAGGSASIDVSTLSVGKHALFARYSGDACAAPSMTATSSHAVDLAPATVGLVADGSKTRCEGKLSLTATVSPSAATGSVEFFDGTTSLGSSAIVSGQVVLSIASLAVGDHTLHAVYSGNSCYATRTSSDVTHRVNLASTTVALVADEPKTACEGKLSLTATVSPSAATGSVQFFDGTTSLGSGAIGGGEATLSIASLVVGAHSLTARYSGDACYASSFSEAVAHAVNRAPSSVTLAADLGSTNCGSPVQLTATVNPGSASGMVVFFDGTTSLGTATVLAGAATKSVSSLAPGAHTLTAVYSGDGCLAGSPSVALAHPVIALPSTLALVQDAAKTACGTPFSLSATLSPGGAGTSVTFYEGTSTPKASLFPANPVPVEPFHVYLNPVTLGVRFTSDVPGSVTSVRFYKDPLNTGAHVVELWSHDGVLLSTAVSSGETASGWQTVALPAPVPIAPHRAYIAAYNAVMGFSADQNFFLAPVNQTPLHAPAETVTAPNGAYVFAAFGNFPASAFQASNYYVDVGFAEARPLGSAPVNAGVATLSLSGLDVGSHTLFAYSSGTGCYGGSLSSPLTHEVNEFTTTLNLAGNPSPGTCQAPLNLIATLAPASATGMIQFFDGSGGVRNHLFPGNPVPSNPHNNDPTPATVGMKFTADVPGYITSIRWYKGVGNTGSHTVGLWTAGGTPLETEPSTGETASGWQEVFLSTPVPIVANQVYVAGVHTTSGYAQELGFFTTALNQSHLHAPADALGNPNGVYVYGPSLAFPTTGYNAAHYGVDVGFTTGVSLGTANLAAGVATLPLTQLAPGFHALYAKYAGDGCRSAGTSPDLVYEVRDHSTTVVVTAAPNPIKEDHKVTLTATVTPSSVTGSVTFFDGVTSLGSPVMSGGVATLSLTSLSTGTHPIHATYGGDDCHAGKVSNPLDVVVVIDTPPTVTVLAPNNGTEILIIGGTAKLAWIASDDNGVTGVDLFISRNGLHGTYEPIATNEANDGTYLWTVTGPGTNTGASYIYSAYFRAVAKDALDQKGMDESDFTFAIHDLVTPALLSLFQIDPIEQGLELRWRLAAGVFQDVTVERSLSTEGPWNAVPVERLEQGDVSIARDPNAESGQEYWYRLVARYADGTPIVFGPLSARAGAGIERLELASVWPNPSPGLTRIEFAVPRSGPVRIGIVDLQGREVAVLVNGDHAPGRYHAVWPGTDARGAVRPGLYFVSLKWGGKSITRRLVIAP